jgi:hypothetical protein
VAQAGRSVLSTSFCRSTVQIHRKRRELILLLSLSISPRWPRARAAAEGWRVALGRVRRRWTSCTRSTWCQPSCTSSFARSFRASGVGLNFEVSSLPLLNPKTYHKPWTSDTGYESRSLVDLFPRPPNGKFCFTVVSLNLEILTLWAGAAVRWNLLFLKLVSLLFMGRNIHLITILPLLNSRFMLSVVNGSSYSAARNETFSYGNV